jgi:tripartite-type tricarboxylate transporter receptor subunit TctC
MISKMCRAPDYPLRRNFASPLALVVCCLMSSAAVAESPARPIRLVVPSVPAGGTDLTWRMIEPKLSELLGQKIVIDNRGGAGGDIGAGIVALAQPDGLTLLGGVSSVTINPAFKKNIPYNIVRDLAPVSLAVKAPNILVSHPALPAQSVPELIAYIKAQPQRLQFASAGIGSMPHLMMELFLNITGLKLTHVAYRGTGQASVDVIAGHVPLMTGNVLPTLPLITSGRLRAYGVTSARRIAAAPAIPTLAESGVTGYEAVQWFGMWAPALTPRETVVKLHRALGQVLNDPALKKRLTDDGADVAPSASPEAFRDFIAAEMRKWARVIKDAGIEMEGS